jgi:integrase
VKFGQLLRKIEVFEGRGDNLTGYALELLALTFVRPGTVQNAKWSRFDLEKGLWVIQFERLKMATHRSEAGHAEDDYIVPLSRQAVALKAA